MGASMLPQTTILEARAKTCVCGLKSFFNGVSIRFRRLFFHHGNRTIRATTRAPIHYDVLCDAYTTQTPYETGHQSDYCK